MTNNGTPPMNVAVLGMGRMGRAITSRLLAGGHRVAVWNRSPGKAADVVSAGAHEAATVVDALSGADVAITMLANDQAVRAVALDEVWPALGEAAVYVDSSTVSPRLTAELAAVFPRFVALPVLGSPAAVRSGQAVFLAGGEADVVASLSPMLSSLSNTVRRYGAAPLALTAKLANNLLLLAEVAALAESMAVGRAGGLSDDQLRELLENNPMLPAGLRNRFDGVLTASQEAWWTTVLGAKDAGLALDVARAGGVTLPLGEVVHQLYGAAADSGYSDGDIATVTALYRPRAVAPSQVAPGSP